MVANSNMNVYRNANGNGHPHLPIDGANNDQPNPHENLDGAEQVATFRWCNLPFYNENALGMLAQEWMHKIRAMLEAVEIWGNMWVSLAIMQLRGEAALW